MLDGILIRGTTPSHEFELPYPAELIKDVRITYGQNDKAIITKNKSECSINNNTFKAVLSQEETLLFVPKKNANIEIRVLMLDGRVIRSEDPITLRVLDSMNVEVLE